MSEAKNESSAEGANLERLVMAGCDLKKHVPVLAQRQDSLKDQLADLMTVGNRLGMYDAVSWIWDQWEKNRA